MSIFDEVKVNQLFRMTTRIPMIPECGDSLLSLFYIKPQHEELIEMYGENCLLSLFYIKPQPYR